MNLEAEKPLRYEGSSTTQRRHRPAVNLAGTGISIVQPKNVGRTQQRVIEFLVRELYCQASTIMNYDHLRLEVPKQNVPLEYRHHRYDIALLLEGRVILIDVLSVKATYWQNGEDDLDGKG